MKKFWGRLLLGASIAVLSSGLTTVVMDPSRATATPDARPVAPAPVQTPGEPKSTGTRLLELGAGVLQRNAPLGPMDIHLVGFHPMKAHPERQMESHHYCHQVNEDFAQCVLFDGTAANARLHGVEFIISERLFDQLPDDERSFWHPHNAEILSGQLVAPGIPAAAEQALMRGKMNSYGKTWHVWHTGAQADPGDALPLGPAMLAWSFNRDAEMRPGLLERRDRSLRIDTAEIRQRRQELRELAHPQSGVDALKPAFPLGKDIPGVVDRQAVAAQAPASAASR